MNLDLGTTMLRVTGELLLNKIHSLMVICSQGIFTNTHVYSHTWAVTEQIRIGESEKTM